MSTKHVWIAFYDNDQSYEDHLRVVADVFASEPSPQQVKAILLDRIGKTKVDVELSQDEHGPIARRKGGLYADPFVDCEKWELSE